MDWRPRPKGVDKKIPIPPKFQKGMEERNQRGGVKKDRKKKERRSIKKKEVRLARKQSSLREDGFNHLL